MAQARPGDSPAAILFFWPDSPVNRVNSDFKLCRWRIFGARLHRERGGVLEGPNHTLLLDREPRSTPLRSKGPNVITSPRPLKLTMRARVHGIESNDTCDSDDGLSLLGFWRHHLSQSPVSFPGDQA